MWVMILTFSSLQTNTDNFENSAHPDETARHEPTHQYLHSLPLLMFVWNPICNTECVRIQISKCPFQKFGGEMVNILRLWKKKARQGTGVHKTVNIIITVAVRKTVWDKENVWLYAAIGGIIYMYLIDRNNHNYSRIGTNANLTLGISVAVLLCLFVCGLICGVCFGIISSSFLQLLLHKKALSHVVNSRALTGENPSTNKASNALLIHG